MFFNLEDLVVPLTISDNDKSLSYAYYVVKIHAIGILSKIIGVQYFIFDNELLIIFWKKLLSTINVIGNVISADLLFNGEKVVLTQK